MSRSKKSKKAATTGSSPVFELNIETPSGPISNDTELPGFKERASRTDLGIVVCPLLVTVLDCTIRGDVDFALRLSRASAFKAETKEFALFDILGRSKEYSLHSQL